MFTLELDLIIIYDPPMSERGGGIHLTRELHLPFAPFNGLQICGTRMDQAPGPEGFTLKDVIWDVEREVFMAHTDMCSHDLPMMEIPDDLKSWIDLGWQMGSYGDHYEEPDYSDEDEDTSNEQTESGELWPVDEEFEQMLQQPTLSPRKRSKALNRVMRAMVRTMVESHNNEAVAYAIDKTRRHFTDRQLEDDDSKHTEAWRAARSEYIHMNWKQQVEWRERVMRTHPRLDKMVEQT